MSRRPVWRQKPTGTFCFWYGGHEPHRRTNIEAEFGKVAENSAKATNFGHSRLKKRPAEELYN